MGQGTVILSGSGGGGGTTSSTTIAAGMDSSADIESIKAATEATQTAQAATQAIVGAAADAAGANTLLGQLKQLVQEIQNQQDPELFEYQDTADTDPWQIGYTTVSAAGAVEFRNTAGTIIAPFATRFNSEGGGLSAGIESRYYLARFAETGVAPGARLRRITVIEPGPPVALTESWQNLDTGAVLTITPNNPDDMGDEIESILGTLRDRVGDTPGAGNVSGTVREQLRAIAESVAQSAATTTSRTATAAAAAQTSFQLFAAGTTMIDIINNTTNSILYVLLGTGTASITNHDFFLAPQQSRQVPPELAGRELRAVAPTATTGSVIASRGV